jgi:dTMP kinase
MSKSMPKRATLIVLEGINGAGKTTIAKLLAERLAAHGVDTSLHQNRSLGPVGDALDDLAREDGYRDRFEMFGANSVQLMAALLKWRELLDLAPAVDRDNHVVILDRYFHKHLARAVVQGATNVDLLRRLFRVFPAPDVALFIDVDPKVAAERVARRAREHNALSLDFLVRLRAGYLSLPEIEQFQLVPGDQDPDTVVDAVWQIVGPKIRIGNVV